MYDANRELNQLLVTAGQRLTSHEKDQIANALSLINELKHIIGDVPWKSCEKDNMEFQAKITCWQMDKIRAIRDTL